MRRGVPNGAQVDGYCCTYEYEGTILGIPVGDRPPAPPRCPETPCTGLCTVTA